MKQCKHKGMCNDKLSDLIAKVMAEVSGPEGDRMVALVALGDYKTLSEEGYTPEQALVVRALGDITAALESPKLLTSLHDVLIWWEFKHQEEFVKLSAMITERTGMTAEKALKRLGLKREDEDEYEPLKHVKPVGNC